MTLEVKHKIPVKEWMNTAFIHKVFTTLQGALPLDEPQLLFVGGCVRNALLGKKVDDIDLATPLEPYSVMKILEKEGVKVIPTGIDHGTVTLVNEGKNIEITTLRRDDKTDGRHAHVSFTDNWQEDAMRRDFTLNTLLMDLEGNIYDPLGCGIKAAQERKIEFVGNPDERIAEDYLRILRFFRFNAYYGQSGESYDRKGLKACQRGAEGIKILSKERITQEFFKILLSAKPHEVLEVMFAHDVLRDLKCDQYDAKLLKSLCSTQERYQQQALSARLLVFLALDIENIKAIGDYILLPKALLKEIAAISKALNRFDLSCDSALRECLYHFGRATTTQVLMIDLAQNRVMIANAPAALDIIKNWTIPKFPLNGKDLIAQGLKEGPALGKELKRLEKLWIKNGFSMENSAALEAFRK
ncbi:MAG: CCA tRNA nucleotidyltransferase [Alphaproteobacteria bacterium]